MVAEDVLSVGEKVTTSLTILITGFVVVFAVLILLIGLIKVYGIIVTKALESVEKRKAAKTATLEKTSESITVADEPVELPEAIDDNGLNEEIIAVIAAAVDAMYGEGTVKVKSIKRVPQSRPVWGTAGIMDNTRPF
ncbi:MAG: OadG family protein [Acutalibacteraceae bacterium]|nr:OadG family protein [Acutalibacteraceae bacterium]